VDEGCSAANNEKSTTSSIVDKHSDFGLIGPDERAKQKEAAFPLVYLHDASFVLFQASTSISLYLSIWTKQTFNAYIWFIMKC